MNRTDRLRVRMAARALALAGLFAVSACNQPSGAESRTDSHGSSPSVSPGISIPVTQMPPEIQCLISKGFRVVKVTAPVSSGAPPGYQLESDLPKDQMDAIVAECHELAPTYLEKTEAELRVIYDRWVGERDCLLQLGYQPVPPPSFERFVASWTTGPWSPLDGIDTGSWTDAQYQEAKQRCTLEFYERG